MPVIYKNPSKFWVFITLIYLQFVSQYAVADDLSIAPIFYVPNLLNIDYGVDSDESRDFFVFTNLALTPEHRISAGYGRHDEIVRGSLEELDTNTYVAGYTYYSKNNYRLGADYEHWGDEGKITTDTLSVFLALDISDFIFTISPQYRQIEIITESNCSGSLDNTALAMDAKYFLNKNWAFNAGYATFDYSEKRDELLGCVEPEEIPFLVARLKSVADDNQVLLGINFYINTETFSLDWARSESAIDGDMTYVTTFYAATDVFDDWTLALTLGTQENYDDTTTDFIKGSVTYYW